MKKSKDIQPKIRKKELPGNVSANRGASGSLSYAKKTSTVQKKGSFVNDPVFVTQINQRSNLELIYGNTVAKEPLFRNLLNFTKLPSKTLAEVVFEITPKTFASYVGKSKKLPKYMIEKVIKLEELYMKGIELFGNAAEFNLWMKKQSYGLGLRIPLGLIGTITGIDMIYDELIRIEFGATA
jgi:hypothetical protein